MALTNIEIKNAKPDTKPYKMTDGGGLFLLVQPTGSKWWRYKYRYGGKEKLLALGSYPEVTLAEVREHHAQARKTLAAGKDPGEAKKEAKRIIEASTNRIYMTWDELVEADLSKIKDREGMRALLRSKYQDATAGRINNWSAQIYAFLCGMKKDDLVVVPRSNRTVAIGVVQSDSDYDKKGQYPHFPISSKPLSLV